MRRNDENKGRAGGGNVEVLLTNGGISTLSAVLQALGHQHRRHALYHLQEQETASIDELAQYIERVQTSQTPHQLPTEQREIRLQLHHTHLPKLTDAHLVDYDTRTNVVSYSAVPDFSEKLLDFTRELENPSHEI